MSATATMSVSCSPMPWKSDVLGYMVVNVIVAFFMTVVVAGRTYARVTGAGLGIDDWFVSISWLLNCPLMVFQGIFSNCGSGYPVAEAMANVPLVLRLSFAFQLIVLLTACFSKLSVLFFYIRVFQVPGVVVACRCAQALVGVWTLSFIFTIIFSCNPVVASWDLVAQATATCINQVHMFMGLIFSNAILDLIIMAIPIRSILQLQMRLTDKIGVLTCILLGIIAVIAAVFRGVYVASVDFTNLTGTMPISIFLSVLEPLLSVICISLPTLRPLWRRYRGDPSSGAGTMSLTGYSHSQSAGGIRVTHDTHVRYINKEVEMNDMNAGGNHAFDESGSERNLTTRSGASHRWSK